MAIGVYRIYVGRSWTGTEALRRLAGVLDLLPAFLHRIDHVSDEDLAAAVASGGPDAVRDAVRIAMTQSHVALIDPSIQGKAPEITVLEIDLAQSGFRRRIPVLGVVPGGSTQETRLHSAGFDRIVPLEIFQMLSAIQDLAEQAAAERRRMNERLLGQPLRLVTSPTVNLPAQTPDAAVPEGPRPLPISEILAALADMKANREPPARPN